MTIKKIRSELLEIIKREAYFKGKIKLSSGKESDYYIDMRRVTLNAEGVWRAARLILDRVHDEHIEAIGGPTLGADPLLGALAVLSVQAGRPLNTFIIRKESKAHGLKRQIEGPPLKEGSRVVLIDDVATTGKALLESLDILSGLKVKVVKALCLVDRNEGAAEALASRGCPLVSIFNISEFHQL